MAGRLHNSLIELVAWVGMDDDTGLKRSIHQPPEQYVVEENNLFSAAYDAHVLAAVSGHLAVYPFQNPRQDENYPPQGKGDKGQKKRLLSFEHHGHSNSLKNSDGTGTPGPRRRITRRISYAAMARKPTNVTHAINMGPSELPVSYEVLNSMPTFCFPDYAYARRYKIEDRVHYLVLTDISGSRSYATCLTLYRPFIIEQDEEATKLSNTPTWRCALWPKETIPDPEEGQQLGYLPACLVLVSKYPYFTIMKDCLSRLANRIRTDPDDVPFHLKDFALQLSMIPVPPSGNLAITFLLNQVQFTLHPPSTHKRPVVDIPLNLVFQCFTLSKVFKLFTALLTQQKIVFTASSYAPLTVIMESFLTFMKPFTWWLPYVPVLSHRLLELIDAPGAFLMGCKSAHRKELESVEGLVIADIDTGAVTVCPTIDLPSLPPGPVALFEAAYRHLQCNFDLLELERKTTFMYEDMKEVRAQYQRQFNADITQAFLHLMVNLLRDTLPHLKIQQNKGWFFDSDRFMEGLADLEKSFYKMIIHTDMFQQFLKDRFLRKSDYWTELEEKTRVYGRPLLEPERASPLPRAGRTGSLLNNSLLSLSSISLSESRSTLQASVPLPSITNLQLPNFISVNHKSYYDKVIEEVTNKLEDCRLAGLRASYLYIRAMVRTANNQLIPALEDFHYLRSCDARLFPEDIVSEILRCLGDGDKGALLDSVFYKESEVIQSILDRKPSVNVLDQHIIMEFDKIPHKDIDMVEFAELAQILEIAVDHDTITRLFEALTLRNAQKLDPATFEVFYECWKETEIQVHELSLPGLELDPSECFLKASNMIKTSFGTGRIALTQKRLFFLKPGPDRHREVIKIKDIKELQKVTLKSFLTQDPALKIVSKAGKAAPFVAWLKDARDAWYMMISEMSSGRLIAEEHRDPAIVQQAAHNVLLLDAVIQSGQEDFAYHHAAVESAAAHLCYFTRRREEGMDRLSPETKDVLQHRVDPNVQEPERKAVEALLYTVGNQSSCEEDQRPRLWCGMANGKLYVFDAGSWLLEPQYVQARDRIVCLVAVGDDQIWAGSFDSTIYVIDIQTKSCYQTLSQHTDMVCGMAVVPKHGTVISASLNGEILTWDMETLRLQKRVTLPDVKSLKALEYRDENLWCCCGTELMVISLAGLIQRRAQYFDDGMAHQIDCFLITPQNEVWLGCGRRGAIAILDFDDLKVKKVVLVPCRGISKMVRIQDKVWAASKGGMIYIFNAVTHEQEKCLKAHSDAIRSLCSAQARYVMSGAGSHDGKVAIWRTSAVE